MPRNCARMPATGGLKASETNGPAETVRPNSGAGSESTTDLDVEARRIASERGKLDKAGAIKSGQDAFLQATTHLCVYAGDD